VLKKKICVLLVEEKKGRDIKMKKEVFVIVLGGALLLTLAMTSVSAIGGLPLDSIAQKAINGEEYVVAGQGLDVTSYAAVAGGEKGIDAFSFSDVSAIGLDNETIQDRINNASQGDTITISAGTYNENVTVNKTLTLIGTGVEVIGRNPFNVTESDVKISDFVVTGTDYNNSVGILTGTNTTIDNCTITNCKQAIKFGADNCTVKNTVITDNIYGIYAYTKINHEICGNRILNSYEGICLMRGNGTEIYDNVIKNSTAPYMSKEPTGIYLSDTGDLIYNNSFIDNDRQAFVFENRSNTWNTSTIGNLWSDYNGTGYYVIDANNTDYLPIGLERATIQDRINNASQGDTINISAGTYNENVTINKTLTLIGTGVEVIGRNPFTVTEADVKISDFVITGTDYNNSVGILTGTNTTIDNCTITNCKQAIKFGADNCTVKNSVITDNLYGIYAYTKINHEICGNRILNSYEGICLMRGNGTEIYDNVIKNSTAPYMSKEPTGIYLSDMDDLIYNNSFIDNDRQAFVYKNRSNTWNISTIGNLWSDYNGTGYYVIDENNTDYLPWGLERASIQDLINNATSGDIITVPPGDYSENVTVNKTLTLIGTDVEVIGRNPFTVTEADVNIIGFSITGTDHNNSVGILTGTNTTIDNCTITNCKQAIKFGADNCTVKNSVITDNIYGIYAYTKINHEICGNQILNSYEGICLMSGNGTKIYDNVIKNSTAPYMSKEPTGIYLSDTDDLIYNNSFIDNDRQAFVYKNRSNTWNTSTIGNLWSDYNGTGYYVIDANNTDYLPRSLSSVGFDTGEGTHPSISGTHNGTITPTQTIEVNWLYTYPCEGTGGHSEYVAFFNVTTGDEIANGTWNGYDSGNYSYITFDVPFELTGGVTYNYEIRTGSYPQILHQKYLQNSMGNITCSEFTDVNGVEYDNWMPAIRLGQN